VYTVRDASGQTTTATLVITVAPVGGDDVATTPAGTVLTVAASGVLGNDAGTALAVTSHTQPGEGSVALGADGSYSYTPPAGYSGVTSFDYTATDGLTSYTQTVTITVTPVAVDDTAEGDVDGVIVLTPTELLDDDLGVALVVTSGTDGAHGTVVVAPDGTVSYTPEPGFSGQDTFTYTITGAGGVATATVTVLVRPSAPDDEIRTRVDEAVDSVTGRLLAAARGTGLAVARYTPPSHGTVVVDADGTYHYTPATGYVGRDSFTYTLVDAFGTEVTGTVTISVVPQLPNTGVDARVWTLGGLLVLLAGLAFAFAARTRRRMG
jgi:LPXTG-motif cell wall-anchored protein